MASKIETTLLTAELKRLSIYRCTKCGAGKEGSTERFSYEGHPEGLKEALDRWRQLPSNMPIGWANYSDGFRCHRCWT